MNLSVIAKILIAIFLGAFLWLVISSIQPPQPATAPEEVQNQLREDLLTIAEDVTINVGDVSIEAELQETYRNGEVHYQQFKMTQTRDERTTVITGRTAQTKTEGTEVDYFIFEKDVVVDTDDGLHLETERLNYESARERIFSQEPAVFQLNDIAGSSNQFVYETADRRLELRGNVDARYTMKPDATEDGKQPAQRIIDIRGQRLFYDQQEHSLEIINNARIAEKGSYIVGDSINADLTEDNRQFRTMTVEKAETRAVPDNQNSEDQEEAEEETEETDEVERSGIANLSNHTNGIKKMEANELVVDFNTGDRNDIHSITANGAATMDITPRGRDLLLPGAEYKQISGDQINARIDPETGGIKTLSTVSKSGYAKVIQRLLNIPPGEADLRSNQPRTTRAKEITMIINPETNVLTGMTMKNEMEMKQGDLIATANSANYQAATETMVMSGKPSFRDPVKLVTGDSITISLLIDDLAASGSVACEFFKTEENPTEDSRSVFAIGGGEGGKTIINAGSLRLDYSNNILRYGEGVSLEQGSTLIRCQELDIFQIEEKLFARGKVNATLGYTTAGPNREQEEGAEQTEESKGVTLRGDRMEINKTARFIRISINAMALQKNMTIHADEIGYELDEEDRIIKSVARRNVSIDLNGPLITGDIATIDPQTEMLIVEGRQVTFKNQGGLSGQQYRKIEFDLKTGAITFYGEGNSPIGTRIIQKPDSK